MHPTSPAQFDASRNGTIPPLEEIRDRLFAVGLPQPGTLPHFTLSYLLLDTADRVHLVDAGWNSKENWQLMTAALMQLGKTMKDVASITITHLHPDHLGMAGRLREASGAPVALHRLEQVGITELSTPLPASEIIQQLIGWGVPSDRQQELADASGFRTAWGSFAADRLLDDGQQLDIPGHRLRVIHTPGHTSGHVALVDDDTQLVFLGDLLLPNQFPGIGLGGTPVGNPIDHYLNSLSAVAVLDEFEALPGHGYRFTGIAKRCTDTAAHHEMRTSEVAQLLVANHSVWDIAERLTWTAGWGKLRGLPQLSALSQTALHVERAQNKLGDY